MFELLEKISRWLTPYKFVNDERPEPRNKRERLDRKRREREEMRQKKEAEKVLKTGSAKAVTQPELKSDPIQKSNVPVTKVPTIEGKDAVKRGELGVKIVEMTYPMDEEDAFSRMKASDSHVAYFFHDANNHQIAVKFEPNSAWRYYERDDIARKKLKPMLFPKGNQPFDRTHIIPIGFHGSENDNRLLVGFNSKLNRNDLNDFEQYVKKVNNHKAILWFVNIEKQPDGSAKWFAYVWDEKGQTISDDVFHDKDIFVWN